MNKKIVCIGIVSLFLLTSLVSMQVIGTEIKLSDNQIISSNGNSGSSDIFTVDDDLVECPDADYTNIQDAIDDSIWYGVGAISKILVYPGIYEENIITKEGAVLYSAEGALVTTIIGNGGTTVTISGSWVIFNGFTVKNTGGDGILLNGDWPYVRECIITGILGCGIKGAGDYPIVYHNDFVHNLKDISLTGGYREMDDGHSGNYWSKATRRDLNGDGIVDLGYEEDRYPLMRSWYADAEPTQPTMLTGPSTGIMGEKYTFTSGGGSDPDGIKVRYVVDWGTDLTNYWPTTTSSSDYVSRGETVSFDTCFFYYGTTKTVTIKVKTVDIYGHSSDYGPTIQFTMNNARPDNPSEIIAPNKNYVDVLSVFKVTTVDPDGHDITYLVDWGDGSSDDSYYPFVHSGTFESGKTAELEHVYKNKGNYKIRVKVQDKYGLWASQMSTLDIVVEVGSNSPPKKPTVTGTQSGKTGTRYTYTASATDPDEDELDYFFDWGDSTDSGWQSSNTAEHEWSSDGTFTVKVKVKDTHGSESEFGQIVVVISKKSKSLLSTLLLQFMEKHPLFRQILKQTL